MKVPFTPFQELQFAITRARGDVAAWASGRGAQRERWAQLAGDRLSEMLQDRNATMRHLTSNNDDLRLVAASLAASYWPPNESFAAEILRLAFHDPQPPVRGASLAALLLLKPHVEDPSGFLSRLLAEVFPAPSQVDVAAIKERIQDSTLQLEAAKRAHWERIAGVHAPTMLQSRNATESFLTHPDPDVRCAALLCLEMQWMSEAELAPLCEEILCKDSETKVRSLALSLLAGCYAATDDKRVGSLAAQIVHDSLAPTDLRIEGYRALFLIRGMPTGPFMQAMSQSFRFPDDVDWRFVDGFVYE